MDHQPRSRLGPKTGQRDRLIVLAERHPDGALGVAEEPWWSRVAQPHLPTWADHEGGPLRLRAQVVATDDPAPKALACYGVLLRQVGQDEQGWRRVVEGRPVSASTEQFLGWCCSRLQAVGVRGWLLIWDTASWQVSKRVRAWMRAHHRQGNQRRPGVRILSCSLPVKRPWLHPIAPQWVQGKRALVEPARLLSAQAVADRVCAYVGCSHEPHLAIPDNVA